MSKEIHEKELYKKFENGKEVLVVSTTEIYEIKETLEKLIRKPAIAETIGANAYEALSQSEQIEDYCDKTIKIYKSLLPC